jgi:hypothetical protein
LKPKLISLFLILLFTGLFLAFNLQFWPETWFDEGIFLQTSKNLALTNRYGIQSSEGFRYYDPIITTGPTVIVPIAILFKFFGAHLLWGRAVILIFSLLFVTIFFIITDSLFGLKSAIIASLLLFSSTALLDDIYGSFIGLSRMVMGELPAMFFLLLGSYLWFRSISENRMIPLLGSGMLFGLATITKSQHVLSLAAFILIFGIDRIWYKKLKLTQVVIPFVLGASCFVIWNIFQVYATGPDLISSENVSQKFGSYATVFSLETTIWSARKLLKSGVLTWGIPGLIYGIYLCSQKSWAAVKRCFLLCIIVINLAWYLFGSISWIRYVFPANVLMNIFSAILLVELADDFKFLNWFRRRNKMGQAEAKTFTRGLAVAIAIGLIIFIPLQIRIIDIARSNSTAPFVFAAYLDDNISPDDIIETYEPEIVFLSNSNFHQPGIGAAIEVIEFLQFGQPYPEGHYDLTSQGQDYIVIGPHAKWTQFYSPLLENTKYEFVHTIGDYDLLRIR